MYESKTYNNTTLQNALGYTDKLQFMSFEEGRIRAVYTGAQGAFTGLSLDYMLKDHLGNVRMLLTDEVLTTQYPAATMEPSTIGDESKIYSNLSSTQTDKPSWFNDPLYSNSTKVARLKNASGSSKVGPSIILKVMAGDSYNIRVTSGWNSSSTAYNNNTGVLTDLLSQLVNGLPTASGGKATPADLQQAGTGLTGSLSSYINQLPAGASTPKAYLNWVLLDEQFKIAANQYGSIIASGYSGFDAVDASGVMKTHVLSNLPIAKSGYLIIYTSNEASNIDVYFDNLQVTHTRGPILEETHYYPFGLTMRGISSQSANTLENKRKWNSGSELQNREFSDGSGLEIYSTQFRNLDPQIGRFWQKDPKPDYSLSLFSSMSNNPIKFNDPVGDSINSPRDKKIAARIESNINRQISRNNQSINSLQNTITGNNERLLKLKADVASGALSGKDLNGANKEISRLEISNTKANLSLIEMQGQIALLNQSLSDIGNLRTDANFNYTFGAPNTGTLAHFITRGSENNVIIQGSDDGLYVHEIRHIGQGLANGGLRFSSTGKLIAVGSPDRNVTRQHEVNAYRAQFSFDRNSYPAPGGAKVLADINIESLLTIPSNEY